MEKIKVASLFCGCGGMDLGVLGGFTFLGKEYPKHPFEIVYAVDFDKYCTKIYNENFEHKCLVKDVRDIVINELPEFDMLIGGFPCQSFSIAAQNPPRLGYKDERGMLFFEMVKILKKRQPRFFIAENVKGILSANDGKAFPMIIKEFRDAGYHVMHKLLNASDYGVPQKRERVIIMGFLKEEDSRMFRYPSKIKREDRKVLGDVVLQEENNNDSLFFSEKAVAGMMAVRNKMNKGRAQNLEEPCNTVSAHLAKVSLNSTDPVLMINGRFRRFSTREAARIQSFPDTFRLESVSQGRQYKAIGNAVPPVMMWHITKALQKVFVVRQLDFLSTLEQYPENIIVNSSDENNVHLENLKYDKSKNVLISYVKSDNMEQYLDKSAKIYYTGKRFPSTVALNKLYYFMPYFKGKGIRDLYLIKIARVGTRKEGQADNDPTDFRLVFEIEYIDKLFDDFQPIKLEIWRTFTDTNMTDIFSKIDN